MTGLRLAASFLTRVPAARPTDAPDDLARAVPWFPVVGAAVGLLVAAAYTAGLTVLPALPAAAIAVAVGVAVTGAFHEDGLADLADGLGGRSPADVRRIMKDPSHGTYGVVAIVFSVVVRVSALAALGAWPAVAALSAGHALARSGAVALIALVPPAADDGLGASYGRWVTPATAAETVVVGLAIGLLAIGGWVLPIAGVVALGPLLVGRIAVRRVGGVTGDVLGAAEQVSECLALLAAVVIADRGGELAWWR